MTIGTAIVSAKGLVKRYQSFVAVDGVDLEIRKGEVLGLLGPNGAGKTTLISMLSTILHPDEGDVTICGYDLRKEPLQIRNVVSLVPQDLAIYLTLTGYENLAFYAKLYGLKGNEMRSRIHEALEITSLSEWAGKKASTYSGGMKRRLNIAIGLLNRPQILFLDEPTVGVDPQSRNHIFASIRHLVSHYQMSVIYTTHYMEEAQTLCDRVAIYDKGRILDLAPTQELLHKHGGTVIELRIHEEAAGVELAARLSDMQGVASAEYSGGKLRMQASDLSIALEALIQETKARQVSLDRMKVQETNLETIFLKLTGKSLRDE